MILALKFICLFMVPMFGFRVIAGMVMGVGFSAANVVLTSLGIAGFITLQWLL